LKRLLAGLLSATLALAAGCGGGDEKQGGAPPRTTGSVAATAVPPRPAAPIAAALPGLRRAVASGDCRQLARFALHSSTRGADVETDAPPTPRECRTLGTLRREILRGFTPRRNQEFGTGAVVEGTGPAARRGEVVTTAWVTDKDGRWKIIFAGVFDPQVGTRPRARTDFALTAARFTTAAHRGDCDTFWRVLDPASRLVVARRNDKARFCRDIAAAYRRPQGTLPELASSPQAKPVKLGETLDIAFFGLPLASGRYVTVVESTLPTTGLSAIQRRQHTDPAVFDYLTSRAPD